MRLFPTLFRFPKIIIISALLIAGGFGTLLPKLKVETALDKMLVKNDPALLAKEQVVDIFGRQDLVVIGLKSHELFTPEGLAIVWRITEACQELDYVTRVVSLTNAMLVYNEDDSLVIRAAFDEEPTADSDLAAFREKVLSTPLLRGNLVARDLSATSVNVFVNLHEDQVKEREALLKQIEEIVTREVPLSWDKALGGTPVLMRQVSKNIAENFRSFAPITLAAIGLVLFTLFHTFSSVILTAIVYAIATVVVLGTMYLAGRPINLMTTMLSPLLLVITTTIVIHILTHFIEEMAVISNKVDALYETIRNIGPPCFLTSLTTALGFISLVMAEIVPIQEFGVFTAFGVIFAMFLSMTFVPAMLRYLPVSPTIHAHVSGEHAMVRMLRHLGELVDRRAKTVLLVFGGLVAISIAGTVFIKAETNFLTYYYRSDPFRMGIEFIEKNLAGATTLDVLITGEEQDDLTTPEAMRFFEDIQTFLHKEFPYIDVSTSPADYLKEMNKNLNGGAPEHYKIPASQEAISQMLLLYSFSDDNPVSENLTSSGKEARIMARSQMVSSVTFEDMTARLREYLNQHCPEHLNARLTGTTVLYANMANALVRGQIYSFGLALVIVTIAMMALFRSPVLGLLAMIPNVTPILMTFGIMGWFDIRLNTATSLTASIAIGIAVDDTIHFVSRYIREYHDSGRDYHEAMKRSMRTIGTAIVSTTVVMTTGFMVLTISRYKPFMYFGLLTSLTMVSAVVADLFLLPALLVAIKPKMPEYKG